MNLCVEFQASHGDWCSVRSIELGARPWVSFLDSDPTATFVPVRFVDSSLRASDVSKKTVCFQGTQLTTGQRLRMQQQKQVRASMSPMLLEQVAETIKVLEARKEQGAKPEVIWTLDWQETGTICIADWMGY
ncbi:hypothetical protein DOH45_23985 [Salmonella enterica subsp. enterica serovar Enteritidis]|nr:hypothetical protein [Salmonella enterica subsp. enterica serovar Enteritidis]